MIPPSVRRVPVSASEVAPRPMQSPALPPGATQIPVVARVPQPRDDLIPRFRSWLASPGASIPRVGTFLGACIVTIAAFVFADRAIALPGAAAVVACAALSARRRRSRPELALRLCLGIAVGLLLVGAS